MGFELTYDNFVSLSFGFFAAFAAVRLRQGLGYGLDGLRRHWRQRRTGS